MKPWFLVDNLYSEIQYPGHSLSASGSGAGAEPWRVATGRRSAQDYWTSAVAGESWIRVNCDQARAADALVLDRGHNLFGRRIILEASSDGFATSVTVLDVVVPADVVRPSSAAGALGALTPEGAWIRRFGSVSRRYWRLRIPSLGSETRPRIVGLWLGRAWDLASYADLPWSDSARDLAWQQTESDAGWIGRGSTTRPRAGDLSIKLSSAAEYSTAEEHLEGGFWVPRPMWIIHDAAAAERAVLAMPVPGRVGFEQRAGWGYRQAVLSWTEHEPRLR